MYINVRSQSVETTECGEIHPLRSCLFNITATARIRQEPVVKRKQKIARFFFFCKMPNKKRIVLCSYHYRVKARGNNTICFYNPIAIYLFFLSAQLGHVHGEVTVKKE